MPKLYRFDSSTVSADSHVRIFWTLLLCGFRKSEYLNGMKVFEDRVVVRCGKRRQSQTDFRSVPLVMHSIAFVHPMLNDIGFSHHHPVDPGTGFQAFERNLRKVSNKTISPHDLRHTYRSWLKLAGIPDERAEIYMGHKLNAKDSAKLYSAYDSTPFLKSDAEQLSGWLATQEEHYLQNYDPHYVEFLEDAAEMNDAGPELIFETTRQKRPPRPSRNVSPIVP
jgi:hypothetical protein